MEIVDVADQSLGTSPPEVNPAPIDTTHHGRPSLGVETLEDRVLLASEAAASMPADVAPPESPAAYVAQQHAPPEQTPLRDSLAPAGASDGGPTSGAAVPDGVAGNSKVGGFGVATSEAHAEVVERPSESKESFEPEMPEKVERRFDEIDSEAATIEPDDARSPRDREAVQRLMGHAPSDDAEPADAEPTELDSPEMTAATASVIVSLTSQREQVIDNLGLNPVVDQLADKVALINVSDVARSAGDRQDATDHVAGASDADPAGDAVAAYASQPASDVDRAADAARFDPDGDIDNGVPAAPEAHDAVFAHGQAMAEQLPS